MNPQVKVVLDERTEALPAQERDSAAGESVSVLTAEQVYAQRLAESSFNGEIPGPSFIP